MFLSDLMYLDLILNVTHPISLKNMEKSQLGADEVGELDGFCLF